MSINKRRLKPSLIAILVLLVIILTLPLWSSPYIVSLFRLIGVYAILAIGLNIFFGYCGQINFGAAAFYAVGAYTSVLLQARLGWHFFACIPVAIVAAGLTALVIGFPLLRLRHHTLALGTVAFAISVWHLAATLGDFTGGEDGIRTPPTTAFGQALGDTFFYYFILGAVAVCFIASELVLRSRYGRAFKAIRENEVAAAAMGVNVSLYKHTAFVLSALYGGLAGALFAQQGGWINPDSFGLHTNINILVMVVIGGMGSAWGAIVGAGIVQIIPQALGTFPHQIPIIYGAILLIVLIFMPAGIAGSLGGVRSLFNRLFRQRQPARLRG